MAKDLKAVAASAAERIVSPPTATTEIGDPAVAMAPRLVAARATLTVSAIATFAGSAVAFVLYALLDDPASPRAIKVIGVLAVLVAILNLRRGAPRGPAPDAARRSAPVSPFYGPRSPLLTGLASGGLFPLVVLGPAIYFELAPNFDAPYLAGWAILGVGVVLLLSGLAELRDLRAVRRTEDEVGERLYFETHWSLGVTRSTLLRGPAA